MDKKKHDQALTGKPIAAKLVAKMERRAHGKVVNLGDVISGRAAATELQKTVATKEDLAGFHPAHAPTSTRRTRCRSCRSNSRPWKR